MRVFIAIKVSESIKKEVWKLKEKIDLPVRWVPQDDLHITLVSPKELSKYAVKMLKKKLGTVKYNKFTLRFDKVSFGPDEKAPRLIWASGNTSGELSDLINSIHSAIEEKEEKRGFLLHMTVARFRQEAFSGFKTKELDVDVDWTMECDNVSVIQSELTQHGAIYTTLAIINP